MRVRAACASHARELDPRPARGARSDRARCNRAPAVPPAPRPARGARGRRHPAPPARLPSRASRGRAPRRTSQPSAPGRRRPARRSRRSSRPRSRASSPPRSSERAYRAAARPRRAWGTQPGCGRPTRRAAARAALPRRGCDPRPHAEARAGGARCRDGRPAHQAPPRLVQRPPNRFRRGGVRAWHPGKASEMRTLDRGHHRSAQHRHCLLFFRIPGGVKRGPEDSDEPR